MATIESQELEQLVCILLVQLQSGISRGQPDRSDEYREFLMLYLLEETCISGNLTANGGVTGFTIMSPYLTSRGAYLLRLLLAAPESEEARVAVNRFARRFDSAGEKS